VIKKYVKAYRDESCFYWIIRVVELLIIKMAASKICAKMDMLVSG
jgi:hypothetical protein